MEEQQKAREENSSDSEEEAPPLQLPAPVVEKKPKSVPPEKKNAGFDFQQTPSIVQTNPQYPISNQAVQPVNQQQSRPVPQMETPTNTAVNFYLIDDLLGSSQVVSDRPAQQNQNLNFQQSGDFNSIPVKMSPQQQEPVLTQELFKHQQTFGVNQVHQSSPQNLNFIPNIQQEKIQSPLKIRQVPNQQEQLLPAQRATNDSVFDGFNVSSINNNSVNYSQASNDFSDFFASSQQVNAQGGKTDNFWEGGRAEEQLTDDWARPNKVS